MKITKETVVELAHLARLNIDVAKHETWADDLEAVFKIFDALDEVDVEQVTKSSEVGGVIPLRSDSPDHSFDIQEVEAMAPEWQDSCFLVPKVL